MRAESPPLSDRETRHTEILQAAVAIFAAEGYQGTDVQDIAHKAGVGKGTVYRHFGDKEQLFRSTCTYCRGLVSEHVARVVPGAMTDNVFAGSSPRAVLKQIAVECARFYEQNPDALEIQILEWSQLRRASTSLQITLRAEMRHGLDALFELACQNGQMCNMPVPAMADAFVDTLMGSLYNAISYGSPNNLCERVSNSMEILLSGMTLSETAVTGTDPQQSGTS